MLVEPEVVVEVVVVAGTVEVVVRDTVVVGNIVVVDIPLSGSVKLRWILKNPFELTVSLVLSSRLRSGSTIIQTMIINSSITISTAPLFDFISLLSVFIKTSQGYPALLGLGGIAICHLCFSLYCYDFWILLYPCYNN